MAVTADDLAIARDWQNLDASARAARLEVMARTDAARAERIETLLRALANETAAGTADPEPERPEHRGRGSLPPRIGPFRILACIGEGGMGAVYLAEQSSPARKVALKIMRADWQSAEAHARFDREADVLARLEHPNIARIFEAGTADLGGRPTPYLAMEFVDGEQLDQFALRRALSPSSLVPLLATIADAVQHAHLRGVVHRDLKPGNVLVDAQGQPHVLDFGIAHLSEGDHAGHLRTRTGQMIGTLQYMSPEQFLGDPRRIDGRTDVYALGVIAYQLFTGQLPHRLNEASPLDAARIVTGEQPRSMSTHKRELRGDLELIVAKALALDLDQRYASAADFAADLRRWERHEPVLARAPSLLYRSQRFVRRQWLPLLAGMLVLLALGAGQVLAWRAAERESQARALAEGRAAEAQAVTDFLTTMLEAIAPDQAQGKEISVRALVDKAIANESLRPTNPLVRARVDTLLGSLLINLGDPQAALPLLDAATRIQQSTPEADPRSLIEAQAQRAIALGLVDRTEDSLRDAEAVYSQARKLQPPDAELVDDAAYSLTLALYNTDDLVGAERVIRESLRPLASDAGTEAQGQIDLRNTLGRVLNARGSHPEALAVRKEVLDWYLRVHGQQRMQTFSVQSNYATSLSQLDRDPEAVEILATTLPLRRELLGPDHVEIAIHQVNLANSLRLLGRYAEALPLLIDGERIFRSKLGGENPRTLLASGLLADVTSQTGDHTAALAGFDAVLATFEKIGQGKSRWALLTRNDHAQALARAGQADAAANLFARVESEREAFAENLGLQGELAHARALWLLDRGQAADARPLLESALKAIGTAPDGTVGAIATRRAKDLQRVELALGNSARAAEIAKEFRL